MAEELDKPNTTLQCRRSTTKYNSWPGLSMPKRVVISWSGGKDSAWTLHTLRQQPKEYLILGLLTTINQQFNRVAIHGVRRGLLEEQALAAGLPLWVVPLPSPCTNEHYERRMTNALQFMKRLGIDAI